MLRYGVLLSSSLHLFRFFVLVSHLKQEHEEGQRLLHYLQHTSTALVTATYSGCFTTCGHYCSRWFPRSLWSKNFIWTCVRFWTVLRLWAFFNSRTRPLVNRVTEPAGGWCTELGGVSFALQALFLPPDSPTQLQTVKFPYHDTSMVFKECGLGRVSGWVFAWPVYTSWSSYYCVFKNPYHLHYGDCAGTWCSEQYGDSFVKAWALEATV